MDNLISSDILWSAQIAQQKTKEVLKNYNSQELSGNFKLSINCCKFSTSIIIRRQLSLTTIGLKFFSL